MLFLLTLFFPNTHKKGKKIERKEKKLAFTFIFTANCKKKNVFCNSFVYYYSADYINLISCNQIY